MGRIVDLCLHELGIDFTDGAPSITDCSQENINLQLSKDRLLSVLDSQSAVKVFDCLVYLLAVGTDTVGQLRWLWES